MKNKFIYIITCVLVFSTSACKDEFLEIVPADQPTVDGFYNTRSEIRSVTASLYGRPWFEFNDKFSWAAGDGLAGDLFNDYADEGQFFFFSYSENNTIISAAWRSLFNVVAYANAIINDMPRIAESKGVSEEVINQALGEARFIRAQAYFLAVEFWGAVPIVEDAGALISANNLNLPKNTISSVREFIKRDLEFAAEHLPPSDDPGRVTQWAAKGLLAKLYLTIAQETKDAGDYDKAKAYALDVIENSGLSLMSNYADLFKIENNNNQESLFALQWISGAWGSGNSRQAVFGRNSIMTGNSEAWGGGKGATVDFVENLENNADGKNDLRRKYIYMELGDFYPEINKANGGYEYNLVTINEKGEYIENANSVLNNIKKYVVGSDSDVGKSVNNQAVPLNLYMLRLADVYFIYAEATLGAGSTTSDTKALQYYNAVRTRAGLNAKSQLSFEDIFNERRVEFGMEGINWLDVKRYYYRDKAAAKAYLNGQNRAVIYQRIKDSNGNDVGEANSVAGYELKQPDTPVTVGDEDMYLPIPAGEVTLNPLLASGKEPVEYVFE